MPSSIYVQHLASNDVMQFQANANFQSISDYLRLCVNAVVNQLLYYVQCVEENWTTVLLVTILYFVLCISLYFMFGHVNPSWYMRGSLSAKERILIVTSHPDDECMFFGPTVVNLTRYKDKKIFLLCLSYGRFSCNSITNYLLDGNGEVYRTNICLMLVFCYRRFL